MLIKSQTYMTQTQGRGEQVNSTPIMSILGSDGTLRLSVPEGTDGAKKRDYETSDGKQGSKWELIFKSLTGKITNLQMYEGDYGTNLMVTLTYQIKVVDVKAEDAEDGIEKFHMEDRADTVSINTNTPFGEDFMKKLPNINLDEFVTLAPYSFVDDKGKTRKGITVTQGDVKLKDFFTDGEDYKKKLHGFPMPKGDTDKYTTDKWKLYFAEARIFLSDYTTEKFIPAFAHMNPTVSGESVAYPEPEGEVKF